MDDERIIAYLKGELSQTERLAFEEQLSQDQALAEAVHLWSLMLAADSPEGRELTKAAGLIKAAVKQEMPRLAKNSKRKPFTGLLWWIVGALIVAVLFTGAYYFLKNGKTEPAKSEVTQSPSSQRSSLDEEAPLELDTAEKEIDAGQPEASPTPAPASNNSPGLEKKPDDKKADVSTIIASRFVPFQRSGSTMGGRSESDTLEVVLNAAFAAYQEGNPEKTIALLAQKLSTTKWRP